MTTDIERQFFETFGIEPREFKSCDVDSFCPYEGQICSDTCPYYKTYKVDYPQITDRILLELICILSEWRQYCVSYYIIDAININTLKSDILRDCLCMLYWYEFNKCGKDIKHQVRTLFEEVENDR